MGHRFDQQRDAEVPATPEQVWEAIATGPGIDSWFIGRAEVTPGEGGTVDVAFGPVEMAHTITGWEPAHRLAYATDVDDDGRFVAYEFLVEGRGGGSSGLRLVTSGFLPGDDWDDEYEVMTRGLHLFFATLVEALTHFPGRTATPVTLFGPAVDDWGRAWQLVGRALGCDGAARVGDQVTVTLPGAAPVPGVVYVTNDDALGIRTADALLRLLRAYQGPMMAGHHLFAPPADVAATDAAWRSWLDRTLTTSTGGTA
jgi:uncharacterized protein YndB with AHSA1/START domain